MIPERLHVSVTVDEAVADPIDDGLLTKAVGACLETVADVGEVPVVSQARALEVSVLIADDAEIQRLNREFRGIDRPTDVLSFSLITDDDGRVTPLPGTALLALGDVVLSYPYATRQAATLGHSVELELSWLLIHGTLQLIGYTHDTDETAEHMEALERDALAALGFSVQ